MHNLRPNLEKLKALNEIQEVPESLTLEYVVNLAEDLQLSVDQLLFEEIIASNIPEKLSRIKMLVMDCDGVLTDGGMYFTKNGDEVKRFNAKDGQGIKSVMLEGITTGIISAGISTGLVEGRAKMLGVPHVYVGAAPKLEILESWLSDLNLQLHQVAYIGDDLKDIPVLQAVGFAACPADAVPAVKEVVDIVLHRDGGQGCVRELVEEYLLQG